MNENPITVKYLVKRPSELKEFSFVATLEEIKAGLQKGEIEPDWTVRTESKATYGWITIDRLLYDPPWGKSLDTSSEKRAIQSNKDSKDSGRGRWLLAALLIS